MSLGRAVVTIGTLIGMLSASAAKGDGECAKGYRDTTTAERETMTRALEGARKQLPAAPQGWVIIGDDKVSVISSLCKDFEADPWNYSFTRHYQRVDDHEAREAVMRAAGTDMAADLKAKQPRLDAAMAKLQALSQRQAALVQKGDLKGAEALNPEIEKVSAEFQRIAAEGDPAARANAAAAEAFGDLEMVVAVTINPRRQSPGDGATSLRVPPGAQSAFRWSTIHEGVRADHALVLLGPWTRATEGGFQPGRRGNASAASPQAMAVHLSADESRLASMLDDIDFSALAASLSK